MVPCEGQYFRWSCRLQCDTDHNCWLSIDLILITFSQGEFRIQSQEAQELVVVAAAASLITENSSKHQILDVTNKVMVNRYMRVFTMFYTAWWTTGLHLWQTCPSRYLRSPPNITIFSDDPRRNTFSVDHRRETPGWSSETWSSKLSSTLPPRHVSFLNLWTRFPIRFH